MAGIQVESAEVCGAAREFSEEKNAYFNPNLTKKTAQRLPALLHLVCAHWLCLRADQRRNMIQHERKLPDDVHSALRGSIDPSLSCSQLVRDGHFPPDFSPSFHGHGLGCQPPSAPPTRPRLPGRCCLLPQAHPSTFTRSITHPHAPRHLHTHTLSPHSFRVLVGYNRPPHFFGHWRLGYCLQQWKPPLGSTRFPHNPRTLHFYQHITVPYGHVPAPTRPCALAGRELSYYFCESPHAQQMSGTTAVTQPMTGDTCGERVSAWVERNVSVQRSHVRTEHYDGTSFSTRFVWRKMGQGNWSDNWGGRG